MSHTFNKHKDNYKETSRNVKNTSLTVLEPRVMQIHVMAWS